MDTKLEQIKKLGNYAVQLFFGEDVGCDDIDIPLEERNLQVVYRPAGYLGEIKILWKGKVKDFKEFDFSIKPTKISNPPERNEYKDDGFYFWGTEQSVKSFLSK
jgi:hypothetical protein